MSNFGHNGRAVQLAYRPKWPINMADLRKPKKIGNTYRILLTLVSLDADFILVSIHTKTSMTSLR